MSERETKWRIWDERGGCWFYFKSEKAAKVWSAFHNGAPINPPPPQEHGDE
jgi:hypothetical protein